MRAFVDTSSLFKKYVEEPGAAQLESLLAPVFEIIIAPITIVEFHSTVSRRLREKTLSTSDARWIEAEFSIDCNYFGIVQWNDDLIRESLRLTHKYPLRTLDTIQLASAVISEAAIVITSDKRLFEIADKEVENAVYIGEEKRQ